MNLLPLKTGQVYVAIRRAKDWEEYPLPPALVAQSTILWVMRSESISDYVLVYYNFSQSIGLVLMTDIYIFDWEERRQGMAGLTPAYTASILSAASP